MSHFINCCHHCTDRYPGCHDHCDTYKKKRAEWDEIKAKDRLERSIDGYLSGNIHRSRDANAKRRKEYQRYHRRSYN